MDRKIKEDIIELIGLRKNIKSANFDSFIMNELKIRHGKIDYNEVGLFYSLFVEVSLWIRTHMNEYRVEEVSPTLSNPLSRYDFKKLYDGLLSCFGELEEEWVAKLANIEASLRLR